MKNLIRTFLILSVLLFSYCNKKSDEQKIAIAQFIDHPGLNAAKEGILKQLKEKGYIDGKNISIDYYNAYGDNVMVNTIANKVANIDYRVVVTLATPISQAIKNTLKNKNTPAIYGVITDPISAGLIKSMEKPGDNNTASSDQWPYYDQLKIIKDYFPKFKRIGIPYNPSEFNTKYAMEQTRKAADSLKLTLIEKPLYNLNEAITVTNYFRNKVDIIYIPADNTAMTAAPTIIKLAKENRIPVLAGDPGTFDAGAMIGLGVSYFDLGKQTADLIIQILSGSKAGELPVAVVKNPELMVNKKVAKGFNITIPVELITKANRVVE